jgi:hypothetical protein
MPGGGGMGRPLGPSGGRDPGGGGTGLPEGLSGGRGARERSGAAGAPGAAVSAGACAAAGASAAVVDGAAGAGAADGPSDGGADGGAADGAGAGAAAAGAGAGRLLLIRRGERAGASDAAGASAAGADTGRAGAFLTGALLAAALLDTDVSGRFAGASPAPLSSPPPVGAADLAALVALPAFLAAAGSSGWTGRRRPSASALRRTRSAWASSMDDEWLLTPIPRERASSSPSLLVRPSSLASS